MQDEDLLLIFRLSFQNFASWIQDIPNGEIICKSLAGICSCNIGITSASSALKEEAPVPDKNLAHVPAGSPGRARFPRHSRPASAAHRSFGLGDCWHSWPILVESRPPEAGIDPHIRPRAMAKRAVDWFPSVVWTRTPIGLASMWMWCGLPAAPIRPAWVPRSPGKSVSTETKKLISSGSRLEAAGAAVADQ